MAVIDLNADVGEWDGNAVSPTDAELVPLVSSVNVACGAHAGNDAVMAATVALAVASGVTVGAHPGFEDRLHFGRRALELPPDQVHNLISSQVNRLQRIATTAGASLHHVKPHGALYNMASRDAELAGAIADAVARVDRHLILVGLAGSRLIEAGRQAGLRTASEIFADRRYQADGSLAPRGTDAAIIHDPAVIAERAVKMVLDREVVAIDGTRVPIIAETICVHSDTPGAPAIARRLRQALEAAGVTVSAIR